MREEAQIHAVLQAALASPHIAVLSKLSVTQHIPCPGLADEAETNGHLSL